MRNFRNTLYLVCLFAVAGCAGLGQNASVPSPQLTPAEEIRVGSAVEEKLLQMLGGPYYDKTLAEDLNSYVKKVQPSKVSVADRSSSALYPLPGGRVILTRGLLANVSSRAELESLLAHALHLSNNVYKDRSTRRMVNVTREFLSASDSPYDPDSAVIRLARLFEEKPCVASCLALTQPVGASAYKVSSTALPESIKRLSGLQPGYELVSMAKQAEQADDQAKAIALYLQAASVTPDEPRILGSLGLAYLRAGQLQQARLHLQKAAKLQPDFYRTQMGLGYLYLQQGKYLQANQALAKSVRMLPVIENLFLLAEAREKDGDVKGAMSLYRLIVDFDRNSKLGRTSTRRLEQSTGVK